MTQFFTDHCGITNVFCLRKTWTKMTHDRKVGFEGLVHHQQGFAIGTIDRLLMMMKLAGESGKPGNISDDPRIRDLPVPPCVFH